MIYGITPNGFVRKRLPEIRAEIIETMTRKLSAIAGYAVTVETSPNSVTGVQIDTFAEREAALWERMEATYYAMYPHTAEGVNLDNAVSFTGVSRIGDSRSTVYGLIEATNGTVVAEGTEALSGQDVFELSAPVTVSQNNAAAFRVEPAVIAPDTNYTITINGASHTYVAPPEVNASLILASILGYLQTLGLDAVQVSGGVDVLVDGRNSVSVGVSPSLLLTSIESVGVFVSSVAGPIEVPAGSLDEIRSTNASITAVRNVIPATVGALRETDTQLAERYSDGPFRLGSSTIPAIRANLWQNVPGIIDLDVVENITGSIDDMGRPDGAIEVIVRGGDDAAIRNEILRVKGGGVTAYGISMGTAYDDEGTAHPIGLTRPTAVYVWVAVRIILKEGASVGASTFQQIQAMIVEQGNLYRTGRDVIRQEFIGPIYKMTDAISEIELTMYGSRNVNYVPNLAEYQEANIDVGQREFATFALNRVAVF